MPFDIINCRLSLIDPPAARYSATTEPGDGRVSVRSGAQARWQTAMGLAGPFLAALVLPPVAGQVALLADPRPDVVVGAVAVLVAIAVTWLLATWSGLVCLAALGARLPGFAGAVARRVLVSITPAVVRRVVLAAVGVSIAAGLAACGSSAAAATPPSGTPTSAIVSSAPMLGSTVTPGVSVDLDWPVTAAAEHPGESARADRTTPPAPSPTALSPTAAAVSTTATPPTPEKGTSAPPTATPTGMTRPPTEPGPSMTGASAATRNPTPHSTARPGPVAPTAAPGGAGPAPIAMDAAAGVIVRPGDSLWSIAAAQLPAGATARQIDAMWRAWYRANLDVIGPNPNLVIPGQVLQAPRPTDAPSITR